MCDKGISATIPELSGSQKGITDDVVMSQLKIRDSHAKTSERPGLGVKLGEEKIRKWSVRTITYEWTISARRKNLRNKCILDRLWAGGSHV